MVKSHFIWENIERRVDLTILSACLCTYRCDHDQAYQKADDADKEQQQLPAVAPSDQVGVEVSHWRHQRLQTHKLGDTCGIVCTYSMLSESIMCVYLCVQAQHDDHDEEADGPELWDRHHGYSSGEGDEGEPRACQNTWWTVRLCARLQEWPGNLTRLEKKKNRSS